MPSRSGCPASATVRVADGEMCAIFAWKYGVARGRDRARRGRAENREHALVGDVLLRQRLCGCGALLDRRVAEHELDLQPELLRERLDRVLRPARLLGAEEAGAAGQRRDERERDRALAADDAAEAAATFWCSPARSPRPQAVARTARAKPDAPSSSRCPPWLHTAVASGVVALGSEFPHCGTPVSMIKSAVSIDLSGSQSLDPTGRIEELPEADRLVALAGPDMDERNVQLFAGSLGRRPR